MCQGLNSHYFHIRGDKLINPIVGVYIPIIRIPIKGGMTIPNIATFDHGTYDQPKQCISIRELPQNYHTFVLFDSPKFG